MIPTENRAYRSGNCYWKENYLQKEAIKLIKIIIIEKNNNLGYSNLMLKNKHLFLYNYNAFTSIIDVTCELYLTTSKTRK